VLGEGLRLGWINMTMVLMLMPKKKLTEKKFKYLFKTILYDISTFLLSYLLIIILTFYVSNFIFNLTKFFNFIDILYY